MDTEQQKEDNMGGRRSDDHRLSTIEDDIVSMKSDNKEMLDDIIYIKTRIDDGFTTSIQSTENKVAYIDEENKRSHDKIENSMKELSKKFDKLLWALLSIPTTYVILQIVMCYS